MQTLLFPDTIEHWQPLTRPRASELEDTRKQLHWAAQIVSALGTTLVEPRADDSHTAACSATSSSASPSSAPCCASPT